MVEEAAVENDSVCRPAVTGHLGFLAVQKMQRTGLRNVSVVAASCSTR